MKPLPDVPILEPYGKEMNDIILLAALSSQLQTSGTLMEKRLRQLPMGWAMYRCCAGMVYRVMSLVFNSLPPKKQQYLARTLQHNRLVVKPEAVTGDDEWILLRRHDADALVRGAMRTECALCTREGREIKRCPLHGALSGVINRRAPAAYGCDFAAMAAEIIQTEEAEP